MKLLLSLALVLCASLSFAQTRINAKIEVDSVEREFIVVVPSGTAPVGGYPMVFMFHGTSGDGEKFYNISGWKEKGEAEKIVTVFPSSLRYCVTEDSAAPHMTTKWNNGDLQIVACPGQTLKDDVKFVRMMVDTITKLLSIDRTRIYASGFSNGGVFTAKLAVEASDIFAAITTSAGPMLDSGKAKRMIPTIFSIGTLDDRACAAFGVSEIPFNDSCAIVLAAFSKQFLQIFGLSLEYTRDSTALVMRYRFNSLAAAATWEYNFVLFNGLGHNFPNGTNFPIAAVDLFWPFFQQYTLPLSVTKSGNEIQPIYLRPNPATDYIIVDEDATVTLFSSTGAEVFTTKAIQDERIALPKIASGVYIAKIETKSGVKSAKVIVQ
jgi:polyhydroxybutyrate depolymerase